MACRVFLADDVEGIRALWRMFLDEDGAFEVVGEAGDGDHALQGIVATRPDVVILDISMPGKDGLEVLRELRQIDPDVPVVVASGFAARRLAHVAFDQGADAFFEKGRPAAELIAMVRGAGVISARRAP
jgi:two-component system invasion response regulator UvrY